MTEFATPELVLTLHPGCVEFPGYKDRGGYWKVKHLGRDERAHRVAYALANALTMSDIAGLVIRHMCNNPSCVNPDHLRVGTHSDNMQDRKLSGNQPKTNVKLRYVDDATAAAIRKEYIPSLGNKLNPSGYAGLGRKYNLHPQAIKQIVNGTTYHTEKP